MTWLLYISIRACEFKSYFLHVSIQPQAAEKMLSYFSVYMIGGPIRAARSESSFKNERAAKESIRILGKELGMDL